MPRRKWIDKNNSTTYQLLHRPQNDPRIHDASSSSMVFQEVAPSQNKKTRDRADLELELFGDDDALSVRDNEGEAAEHGIYFDDTQYDYMQHMRDLNSGTESVWVEAPQKDKGKGKEKVSLEEALKDMDIGASRQADTGKLIDESILPSKNLKKVTYQDQQDVPDVIAGFQPDMDPRLREVLEALEDEEYVDTESKDDSFFAEIAEDAEEISLAEFEDMEGELDDGWSTDDTVKPHDEHKPGPPVLEQSFDPTQTQLDLGPDHGDGEFMATFRDLPKSSRVAAASRTGGPTASILTGASALTAGGRKKKRKGALTNSDAYSMTSSSLFRTEGQTVLDARFDKMLETYEEGEEDGFADDDTASIATGQLSNVSGISGISGVSGLSKASGYSRTSQAPSLVVGEKFDALMDDFLGSHSMKGKRRVKKGKYQTGMQQLDEIRSELGPPVGKTISANAAIQG